MNDLLKLAKLLPGKVNSNLYYDVEPKVEVLYGSSADDPAGASCAYYQVDVTGPPRI
jgi:hypothetical protein